MKRTVRSSIGEVSVREDGIILGKVFAGSEINLDDAKDFYSLIEYLSDNKPHCTIMDLTGISYMSAEARAYIQERSSELAKTIAVAIVTSSFTSKMIGNFFLTSNKPSFPIKLFSEMLLAHQWAKSELDRFHSKLAS
ncbi:MAG: hypothetical protein GC178_10705 [Flavobacteriales bacterium]|nr:hypothetical protein [Flavobacteriales bacterium]